MMSFCTNCGHAHLNVFFPKTCTNCNYITYSNPLPVAVAIVPVKTQNNTIEYLLVERNIEPNIGQYAFPGGFIENKESFQQAASRELFEETSIFIEDQEFELIDIANNPAKTVILIFLMSKKVLDFSQIDFNYNNEETKSIKLTDHSIILCFSTHQSILEKVKNVKKS